MANPEFSESGKGLRLSVTKRRDSEGKLVCTEYSVHNTENSKSFKRIYFLVSLLALVSLLVLPSSLAQVCISAAAVGVALLFTTVVSESVVVFHGVGVQLQTRYRAGRTARRFIGVEDLRAVIINEGVGAADVKFYLAFVLHDAPEMEVAFRNLMPRLETLKAVYRGVQEDVFG